MRRIDDRWTKRTLEWILRDAMRPRGRQPTRWGDVFATQVDHLRAQVDTAQGPHQRHPELENILDDIGEGTKRVEEMLGPHVQ
ncbi:hypothetical protein RB195_018191 [Necator americanus]|uniref:Uncharacterized protein n=1 Tax=Necator americanus TaxID=51031 RepID=A0ABR1C8M0_NECAM